MESEIELQYYHAFEQYMKDINQVIIDEKSDSDSVGIIYYSDIKHVSLSSLIEHVTSDDVSKFTKFLKSHHVPNGLCIKKTSDGDEIVSYHHAMLIICLSQSRKAVESIKTISENACRKKIGNGVSNFISVDGYTGFVNGRRVFIYPANKETHGVDCWLTLESVKTMLGYKQDVKDVVRDYFKGENSEFVDSFVNLISNNIIELPDCENMFNRSFSENLAEGALMPRMQERTKMINLAGLIYLTVSSNMPKAKEYSRWIINEIIPQLIMRGQVTLDDYKQTYYIRPDDKRVTQINKDDPSGLYIIKSPLFNHKYGQTTFGAQRMKQHSLMYISGYKKIVSDYKNGNKFNYTDADFEIAQKIANGEMQPFQILLFIEFDNPSILERMFRNYICSNGLSVSEKVNGVNKDEFFRPTAEKTIDQIINDAIHLAGTKPSKSARLIHELEKTVKALNESADKMMEREKHYIEQMKFKDDLLKQKEEKHDQQMKAKDDQLKTKDEQLKIKDEQLRANEEKHAEQMKAKDEQMKTLLDLFKASMTGHQATITQPQVPEPVATPKPVIIEPQVPKPPTTKELPSLDDHELKDVIELFKKDRTAKVNKINTPVTEVYNSFCDWLKLNYKIDEKNFPVKQIPFGKIFKKYYVVRSCPTKTKMARSYVSCELIGV